MQLAEFADVERFDRGDELLLPDMARHGGQPVQVCNYRDRNSGDAYQVCESAGFFRKAARPGEGRPPTYGQWKRLLASP